MQLFFGVTATHFLACSVCTARLCKLQHNFHQNSRFQLLFIHEKTLSAYQALSECYSLQQPTRVYMYMSECACRYRGCKCWIKCNEKRRFRDPRTFLRGNKPRASAKANSYAGQTLEVLLSRICDHFVITPVFRLVQLQLLIE